MSAPTILTDFCLFVSEGDGLAGCGDVCSSFSDQLCELVRLAKAKLARPYQVWMPRSLPCTCTCTCTYDMDDHHNNSRLDVVHVRQARWGDERTNGCIDEYLNGHCDLVSCKQEAIRHNARDLHST